MQLLSKPLGICCLPSRAGVGASWPLQRPGQWGVCTQPGRGASRGICPASLGCQGTEGSRLSPAGIYILIAVGAVMMFVGFLGCYGAIQESQCLLGTVRPWAGARLRVRAAGPARGRTGSSGGDRTPSVPDVEPGAPPASLTLRTSPRMPALRFPQSVLKSLRGGLPLRLVLCLVPTEFQSCFFFFFLKKSQI